MSWIWQRPGWPDFTWSQAELEPLETRFRDDADRRIDSWRRLGEDEQVELRIAWLSDEGAETSAIEGELLDRIRCSRRFAASSASPMTSVQRHRPKPASPR